MSKKPKSIARITKAQMIDYIVATRVAGKSGRSEHNMRVNYQSWNRTDIEWFYQRLKLEMDR